MVEDDGHMMDVDCDGYMMKGRGWSACGGSKLRWVDDDGQMKEVD